MGMLVHRLVDVPSHIPGALVPQIVEKLVEMPVVDAVSTASGGDATSIRAISGAVSSFVLH